jgi:putative membrane protein
MGFFLLIINGLMLGLVAFFVPGFHVNGLLGAVIGSVLVSIVTWILSATVGDK